MYLVAVISLMLSGVEIGLRIYLQNRVFGLRVYRSISEPPGYALAAGTVCEMVQGGRAVHISIDALGHRVTPGASSDSSLPTIHLIGDSQVFGQGLSDQETLGYYLQKTMGDRFRVVNYGVPGYGPFAYKKTLQSIPKDDWAVVVHTEYNDLRDSYSERTQANARCGYLLPNSFVGNAMPCFGLNLRLFQLTTLFSGALIGDRKPLPVNYDPHDSVAAKVLMYRVRKLYEEEIKKRGKKLVFTVIPWDAALIRTRLQLYSPNVEQPVCWVEFPDDCDMKQHFLQTDGVESLYLPFDEHLSPKGASVLATVISNKIHEREATQ